MSEESLVAELRAEAKKCWVTGDDPAYEDDRQASLLLSAAADALERAEARAGELEAAARNVIDCRGEIINEVGEVLATTNLFYLDDLAAALSHSGEAPLPLSGFSEKDLLDELARRGVKGWSAADAGHILIKRPEEPGGMKMRPVSGEAPPQDAPPEIWDSAYLPAKLLRKGDVVVFATGDSPPISAIERVRSGITGEVIATFADGERRIWHPDDTWLIRRPAATSQGSAPAPQEEPHE